MSPEVDEKENEKRWLILRSKVSGENIKSAFRLFRENGVEPVLIKGWAAAKEYPESYQRNFSDIDLCVAPDEFERCLGLVTGEAFKKLNLDLHRGLRHLDTVGWDRLFQNSVIAMLDDVPVRILRREDHLRVLCVHWLTDGGAHKERLLDIYYLLQNDAEDFSWEYCFEGLDRNRRDWIIKTVAVVHKFHDLDVSRIPFAAELNTIPEWFTKALNSEWASATKLKDIHALGGNRKEFWKQLKKRFQPNAIQATVLMEGRFDESSRIYYQFGSFIKRLKPSVKKTLIVLKSKLNGKFVKNA